MDEDIGEWLWEWMMEGRVDEQIDGRTYVPNQRQGL